VCRAVSLVFHRSPSPVTDPSILAEARAAVSKLSGFTSIGLDTLVVWQVDARDTIPTVLPLSFVQLDRQSSIGGSVVNSTFSDAYDSVFRLQASHTTVAGNTFTRASAGVHVVFDRPFLEGSLDITDVAIHDNVFIGVHNCPNISSLVDHDPSVRALRIWNNTVTA